MNHSDLIIIGAGPGGYETAVAAAHRGLSVTIFEGANVGGTCLNAGCIPTKCLVRNAEVVEQFKDSEKFGIDNFTFELDFNKVMSRKDEVVATLRAGVEQLLASAKVNVVKERASFTGPHTVKAGETEYEADNIILATGSVSKALPIPGADLPFVMDSTAMLSIDHIPESLTVVGGGVIGMEFASVFHALGSKVTVVEYMKQILPPFDADIAKRLKQSLSKQGIEIITGAAVKEISQAEDYEIVTRYECKGKEGEVRSSDLLMAVGRAPYWEGLNLEAAGFRELPAKGRPIPVDDYMRTEVPHIFAIGDVNGRMMLAHVATFQGLRALNAITGKEDTIDFGIVPSAVFTHPECGMVGLTEQQCKDRELPVKKGTSFFRANGKALAMAEPEGICKLLFHKETGLLLGAHIMGAEAADLAQQCADLMSRKTTQAELEDIIFSHPTISEVILSAAHSAS